ncbi:MAG: hypothetical protein AB7D57_15435, partial [Desulfovibrionaceae bacterium]
MTRAQSDQGAPKPPARSWKDADFARLCRANWDILEGRKLQALWCVLLLGAAGLTEGSAIMVLIPALKGVAKGV